MHRAATAYGFKEDAFDAALERLGRKYEPLDYFADNAVPEAFTSWVGASDELKMFITQVKMDKDEIDEVYARFAEDHDVVIFDQGYFAGKAAEGINNDFYLILFISSFLIFFVLWLSYGRLELALLSFLPMAIRNNGDARGAVQYREHYPLHIHFRYGGRFQHLHHGRPAV